jgi:eukaryotic-like serine/threonine-protein kinase
MAPEQAAGRAVDARADVYALGAILHHVLAGAPPEPRSGATSAAAPAPVPLAALEPRLPPDLLAVVAKALAADPQARYATAFELAEDLRRFQAGQLVGARRYSTLARVARLAARHPLAAAASATALLAALVALAAR